MTLLQAITVCKEMQKWRRSEPPYDIYEAMPYTPDSFGEAVDILINLAEKQVEMEKDMERFVANLVRASKG